MKTLFLICVFLSTVGCSKSGRVDIVYLNGVVNINGAAANTGLVEGKEISINTGKNSSVIAQTASKAVFALSEETSILISDGSFILVSGRIIAAPADEIFIKSREVSVESEKSLFELISRSNVSVVNNYSGDLFVKGITPGAAAVGISLNENFTVESVNGSFSPSQSLRTDIVRKAEPLKALSVWSDMKSSDLMNKISPECISIINSPYGKDIEQRYSLKTLSSKYGVLSEIITKNGKIIIGAVRISGSKMKIYTVDGDRALGVSEVKSMKRYNGE